MNPLTGQHPDPDLISDLVRRIVAAVHPIRIILFGSAARGQMGPNSDLDVLVVMPDGTPRRKTAQYIYLQLFGFGFPKDIVVANESDMVDYRDNPGLVYKQALDEGKVIYSAVA